MSMPAQVVRSRECSCPKRPSETQNTAAISFNFNCDHWTAVQSSNYNVVRGTENRIDVKKVSLTK